MKKEILNEQGRSMVEMLGVLAIIGVLSVMGIAGYKSAMTRHRANELLNEASKRAVVVAGQITLGGGNPSLSEFANNSFAGGTFENSVYGASGAATWTNIGATPDKQFTLSITGVEGNICAQMKSAVGDNAVIKHFAPETCDTGNDNNVKLTYNNDLSTDTIPSGDNNTGNAPTTPSTCAANNMYWCVNSQTCVANQAACLALCPEERLCGNTCCGTGNVCVDGNKCCQEYWDGDESLCCDASTSTGFNVEYEYCCPLEAVAYHDAVLTATACCPNDHILLSGSWYGESGQFCCPEGSTGYSSDGCCEAGTIVVPAADDWKCCPANSAGYDTLSQYRCCEAGEIALHPYNDGETVCCPPGSTDWNEDDGCIQ